MAGKLDQHPHFTRGATPELTCLIEPLRRNKVVDQGGRQGSRNGGDGGDEEQKKVEEDELKMMKKGKKERESEGN